MSELLKTYARIMPKQTSSQVGNKWNDMNYTDRANYLSKSSICYTGWANESWHNLPKSIRDGFTAHCEIVAKKSDILTRLTRAKKIVHVGPGQWAIGKGGK